MPFWQVVSHDIAVWDKHAHFSGIVGLGHPSRIPEGFDADPSSKEDKTLLAAMGVGRFAICLGRGGPKAPGWLSFGSAATSVGGSFQTIRVVGKVHWGVELTEVSAVGAALPNPCYPSCGAIVDSGTSLIAVPPSALPMVRVLSKMVRKDCSNLESLPVLHLKLGGVDIQLPPRAYVVKAQTNSTSWQELLSGTVPARKSQCSAAFMVVDKTSQVGPVWILGMPFLRYYYTVFDRTSRQIHIAQATPTCAMKPPVESTGLLNTTGFGVKAGVDVGLGARTFSAADYEATEADLGSLRMPSWALASATANAPFIL
mmetsp:Transcript_56419/g.114956  ORF Transcript_56419/g.114956 Transcript_56419/m.114956 type:complete len:314 (+) Transcript_56419:2-943(+)